MIKVSKYSSNSTVFLIENMCYVIKFGEKFTLLSVVYLLLVDAIFFSSRYNFHIFINNLQYGVFALTLQCLENSFASPEISCLCVLFNVVSAFMFVISWLLNPYLLLVNVYVLLLKNMFEETMLTQLIRLLF